MAGSRVEKVGSIFSRAMGLIRSRAMKWEDRPLWIDVYAAFPPKQEPRHDRPASNAEVRPIFYPEDAIRAQFYKEFGSPGVMHFANEKSSGACQTFLNRYYELAKSSQYTEAQQVFAATVDSLEADGI